MPTGSRPKQKPVPAYLRTAVSGGERATLFPLSGIKITRNRDELTLHVPRNSGRGRFSIHLTDWLDRPQLAMAVASHVSERARTEAPLTVQADARILTSFLTFLRHMERDGRPRVLCVRDLTQEVVDAYRAWLDGDRWQMVNDAKPLADTTKAIRYSAVRLMYEAWSRADEYKLSGEMRN